MPLTSHVKSVLFMLHQFKPKIISWKKALVFTHEHTLGDRGKENVIFVKQKPGSRPCLSEEAIQQNCVMNDL